MAALKQIKSKIRSVEKTQKVTKAMEAVSAAKMRKAQTRALAGRAYARAAVSVLARVSASTELNSHPLLRGSEKLISAAGGHQGNATETNFSSLYIVITSDKGLAGALNSAVLRTTWADMKGKEVKVVTVGRRANDFFVNRGIEVLKFHPNTDEVTTDLIKTLVGKAADLFESGKVDEVKIAYQNFVSTFEQRPTLRTIFPLSLGELSQVVADIVPARGVFAHDFDQESKPKNYTIEPGETEVLSQLLPMLASVFVYHALLESQASEHSARMVAMKSASDKAGEMNHSLTLKFNKARQASITREVSEITGGMEAMAA
ncbi:ATP synthase F1 subunit gamma [Candidatus Parcubacteria bacterium]|nr:ATP synthase F1 subunit gamma [Candidatus Parcubacteria bacterium]